MFEKLAKKPDPVLFLVSNLYKKPNSWLGEFINENGDKNYKEFIKRHESITFYFQEDLTKMLSSLDDNLIVNNGQHPYLLKLITREEVGLDTVLILNKILNFFPYWDKNIVENVIWPSKKFAIEKCDKFVHFSEAKCKKALEDHFN